MLNRASNPRQRVFFDTLSMAPRRTRAEAAALAKLRAASAPEVAAAAAAPAPATAPATAAPAAAPATAAAAASKLGGFAGPEPPSHIPPLGANTIANLAAIAEFTAQQRQLYTAHEISMQVRDVEPPRQFLNARVRAFTQQQAALRLTAM